tara:strand:+ start:326 stop:463 length:138 start_codon:yes stop_codon:yes gene_type:complete
MKPSAEYSVIKTWIHGEHYMGAIETMNVKEIELLPRKITPMVVLE